GPRNPFVTLGTLPVMPGNFLESKHQLPIYQSSFLDHSRNPHVVHDLIREFKLPSISRKRKLAATEKYFRGSPNFLRNIWEFIGHRPRSGGSHGGHKPAHRRLPLVKVHLNHGLNISNEELIYLLQKNLLVIETKHSTHTPRGRYSLRPELLVVEMDVSRCILVLETSIFARSNSGWREYS
ncbi:hypothetical protein ZWY2020_011031, partial [Hordeum vulgare]